VAPHLVPLITLRLPLALQQLARRGCGEPVLRGAGLDLEGDVVLPFAAVQQSLMTGRAQGGAPATLVPDYNAETNVITARICAADGLQPHAVCARPVIRTILTALKRGRRI